jgi:uncharacterized protein (DUF488 family)
MADTLRAYSLGYEGMSLDKYVEVLKANNITVVIDVRETPWSYKPGFSKKPLSERLQTDGICYVHLKSAGNPSRNRKMGLPQHMVIDLYKQHLNQNPRCLDEIYDLIMTTGGSVCLLCFEQQPHDCHRKVILDRIAENSQNLMTCHLSGRTTTSEETVARQRIPKANNRKGSGVHMKISQNKSRLVSA